MTSAQYQQINKDSLKVLRQYITQWFLCYVTLYGYYTCIHLLCCVPAPVPLSVYGIFQWIALDFRSLALLFWLSLPGLLSPDSSWQKKRLRLTYASHQTADTTILWLAGEQSGAFSSKENPHREHMDKFVMASSCASRMASARTTIQGLYVTQLMLH